MTLHSLLTFTSLPLPSVFFFPVAILLALLPATRMIVVRQTPARPLALVAAGLLSLTLPESDFSSTTLLLPRSSRTPRPDP
jgi:hypothetical protein